MKKIILLFATIFFMQSVLFAYNPPVQGENIYGFSTPLNITQGFSTVGGGLISVTPSTVLYNPAIAAFETRVTMDLGYTAFFSPQDSHPFGSAFGIGIIIPSAWCNFGAQVSGNFSNFSDFMLGNMVNFSAFAAKEVVENFYIGLTASGGVNTGYNTDWALKADIGAIYNFGDIAFLKDFRVGLSVLNLGKVYNHSKVHGADGRIADTGGINGFPHFATIRTGAACKLVDVKNFALGVSVDVTLPLFLNFIIDTGVQIQIFDFLQITSSWEYNAFEAYHNVASWLPTVGVVFKFNIGTGVNDYMKKNDWNTSEISPQAAWKNINKSVNAFSLGAVLRLGQLDTDAPEIEILE